MQSFALGAAAYTHFTPLAPSAVISAELELFDVVHSQDGSGSFDYDLDRHGFVFVRYVDGCLGVCSELRDLPAPV